MGIKRVVDISFWTDSKVIYFTPEDKYFMLYLLTNPHTTQLGIYELNVRQCAFELGYSEDSVKSLFDRFEKKYGIIKRSGEEIAIKNFLRHSIIKGGKPVEDCLEKEIKAVKNKNLLSFVKQNLIGRDDLNETVKKVFENPSILLKENDNDNDNDNEVSYHDSYHDSLKPSKKAVDKSYPQDKEVYADSVTMTSKEYDNLCKKVGSEDGAKRCIEILSNYKLANGKKYKSDYHAILNWAISRYKEELAKNKKPKVRSGAAILEEAEQIARERGMDDIWV